jgi:hypothetical protein
MLVNSCEYQSLLDIGSTGVAEAVFVDDGVAPAAGEGADTGATAG